MKFFLTIYKKELTLLKKILQHYSVANNCHDISIDGTSKNLYTETQLKERIEYLINNNYLKKLFQPMNKTSLELNSKGRNLLRRVSKLVP